MSRYGLFTLKSLDYAIPLLQLKRIVREVQSYFLPRLPTDVAAVLVDDGRLVPLLTLSSLFDGDVLDVRRSEYKVFVESEGGTIAFPAEITRGIVAESKGELLTPEKEKIPGSAGCFKYQEKEFIILDIDFWAIGMTRRV